MEIIKTNIHIKHANKTYKKWRWKLKECKQTQPFDNIRQDIIEVELYDMVGVSPRMYVGINNRENIIMNGIPSYTQFKRNIRELQLLIGE